MTARGLAIEVDSERHKTSARAEQEGWEAMTAAISAQAQLDESKHPQCRPSSTSCNHSIACRSVTMLLLASMGHRVVAIVWRLGYCRASHLRADPCASRRWPMVHWPCYGVTLSRKPPVAGNPLWQETVRTPRLDSVGGSAEGPATSGSQCDWMMDECVSGRATSFPLSQWEADDAR